MTRGGCHALRGGGGWEQEDAARSSLSADAVSAEAGAAGASAERGSGAAGAVPLSAADALAGVGAHAAPRGPSSGCPDAPPDAKHASRRHGEGGSSSAAAPPPPHPHPLLQVLMLRRTLACHRSLSRTHYLSLSFTHTRAHAQGSRVSRGSSEEVSVE